MHNDTRPRGAPSGNQNASKAEEDRLCENRSFRFTKEEIKAFNQAKKKTEKLGPRHTSQSRTPAMNDFDTIKSIIVELTGNNPDIISKESDFVMDLGFDSLDRVEFVMELENEFGLDITDEEADKLKTVQDALNFVEANQD
jgi:acyl carrier protein